MFCHDFVDDDADRCKTRTLNLFVLFLTSASAQNTAHSLSVPENYKMVPCSSKKYGYLGTFSLGPCAFARLSNLR